MATTPGEPVSPKKHSARQGSGGKGRRRLAGKGPTPKAENRTYHQAYRDRIAAERQQSHARGVKSRTQAKDKYRARTSGANEIIYGRNPVAEAVRAGVPLKQLFVSSGVMKDARLSKIAQHAAASGVSLKECSFADLDRICAGGTHQGVAAEIAPYEYLQVEELWRRASGHNKPADTPGEQRKPLIVALDKVTDPHNLGAVLRSAAAFGAAGVIVPERHSAPVNAAVWKVSAGAAAMVPVAQCPNLTRALQMLQSEGAFVVGLDGGGDTELSEISLDDVPLVIVTGSEGKGLSRLVRETCDQVASIPISARMESLNAAVATGIALYELSKNRGDSAILNG